MRLLILHILAILPLIPCGADCQPSAAPAAPAALSDQDLRGFWNRDDARDWTRAVQPNSSRGVVYGDYPMMLDQVKEDAKAEEARRAAEAKLPVVKPAGDNPEKPVNSHENMQNSESSHPKAASTPLSREQILAKYGSPEDAQIIRAQKDSPPAMQGLFEALNSNDKELAFKYAMALARRQGEMQKVVSKATDYQILAMEALGIRPAAPLPDDGEPMDLAMAEVRDYYEQARQEELKKGAGSIDLNLEGQEQEANAQQAARQAAAAQSIIPIDPEGNVKILIFLDEKAADSAKIAESLKPIRAKHQGDPKISVFGLTKRTYSLSGLKKYAAELSFPFPLVSGEALAIDMRIKGYPTTVFVAATTKETYRVDGVPSVEEIERTVRVMRGGR